MKEVNRETFKELLELFREKDPSIRKKSLYIKTVCDDGHYNIPMNFYVSSEVSPINYSNDLDQFKKSFEQLDDPISKLIIGQKLKMDENKCLEEFNTFLDEHSDLFFICASNYTFDGKRIIKKSKITFIPIDANFYNSFINNPESNQFIVNSNNKITVQLIDTEELISKLEFCKNSDNIFYN